MFGKLDDCSSGRCRTSLLLCDRPAEFRQNDVKITSRARRKLTVRRLPVRKVGGTQGEEGRRGGKRRKKTTKSAFCKGQRNGKE